MKHVWETRIADGGLSFIGAYFLFVARAQAATNRVSAIRIPGAPRIVKAMSGADGAIHLLFDSADGPRYANSKDDGLTFSVSVPIVDAAAQKVGLI